MGFTTDREFIYEYRCHPAPKVLFDYRNYTLTGALSQLRFDDAFHWADGDALRRVMMTFAFNAGFLIDDIQDAVTFADGFGGAFGDTGTAGDAFFSDLHGHVSSPNWIVFAHKDN